MSATATANIDSEFKAFESNEKHSVYKKRESR